MEWSMECVYRRAYVWFFVQDLYYNKEVRLFLEEITLMN